ncbi:MAG: hypothetical protein KatS3mg131_3937 [Candidatus Tectimicrobiota bacterium]|nr:MAG: hypothetical protein KatS3mg131_3937 [Candidatus Tectomicrobia bacterium]
MRIRRFLLTVCLGMAWLGQGALAQQMPMMPQPPGATQPMAAMGAAPVPTPDLVITAFEKQVVLPDRALPFTPTGMGQQFFAKLIAKVDFGRGVWFSIRKARIPPGGHVGIMRTTEICYIERGLGLLLDAQGKTVQAVPAGSWFTVPTNWAHTLKSIGEEDLIMTVIRVGPKEIH